MFQNGVVCVFMCGILKGIDYTNESTYERFYVFTVDVQSCKLHLD